MEEQNLKLYYNIKEVAQMFNLNESTLRYWEKEFPDLKPRTTGNKVRQYSDKDIEVLRRIHNLVKERGFKIAAAKKVMHENRDGVDKSSVVLEKLVYVRDQLTQIKTELSKIV